LKICKESLIMKELINKFREYMRNNKGNVYPIENHTLALNGVDEYTKETYLKMLCVIMRYDGQGSEEQALFIKRLIKGIDGERSFEEYLRKAMELDDKFIDEILKQIEENNLKYIFTIDCLLITYTSPNVSDEQIGFAAELAEIIGIKKDEMELIVKFVKSVLEQDCKGYLDICRGIEIKEEKEKLLIPLYPYANQYVGGCRKLKEIEPKSEEKGVQSLYYLDYPRVRDVVEFGRLINYQKDIIKFGEGWEFSKLKWRVLAVE